MRMRTLRPNVLQRTHGPNDTEEKRQKENKKQIEVEYAEFPPFLFLHFLQILHSHNP